MENNRDHHVQADSSEEEIDFNFPRIRKHFHRLTDSDSDLDKENKHNCTYNCVGNDGDESDSSISKNVNRVSHLLNTSEIESHEESETGKKNIEQQMRMKNKRNKLKEKFNSFVASRCKDETQNFERTENNSASDDSNDGISSIEKIKQKIKERTTNLNSSLYDPDTSEEDSEAPKLSMKCKKGKKTILLESSKPVRISAKEAMENMKKIKSESNRMLREQQVSLPYHKPKALTLKDIMNRRKPAISSDGKILPIKMNEEQLKQYALNLEQRQKEIMELCKSESDEDDPTDIKPPQSNLEANNTDIRKMALDSTDTLEKPVNIISANLDTLSSKDTNSKESIHNLSENLEVRHIDLSTNTSSKSDHNHVTNAFTSETSDEVVSEMESDQGTIQTCTDSNSQLITLNYDSEHTLKENENKNEVKDAVEHVHTDSVLNAVEVENNTDIYFSDEDVNMEDIDTLIENAEIINSNEALITSLSNDTLRTQPKLTGAPGMLIDLNSNSPATNKLTGIELLKERFTYFSNIKTSEELERAKEKRLKPGTQHLKLKQELEEKIAEQRSLEWAKRLEEDNQNQKLNEIKLQSDEEEDIDKMEAKLEKTNAIDDEDSTESEEEEEDAIIDVKEKPRVKNPLIQDEAEESDDDEFEKDDNDDESDEESETSGESSDSEPDNNLKPKKSRILKAFEDSDNEGNESLPRENLNEVKIIGIADIKLQASNEPKNTGSCIEEDTINVKSEVVSEINCNSEKKKENLNYKDSQDEIIELAQKYKSGSEDLFSSQDSVLPTVNKETNEDTENDNDLPGTQTFSILNTDNPKNDLKISIDKTQSYEDDNFEEVNAIGSFTKNIMGSELPIDYLSQSQPIGEDILALCTGKFYDNEFVSITNQQDYNEITQEGVYHLSNDVSEQPTVGRADETTGNCQTQTLDSSNKIKHKFNDENVMKSMLDELNDPEFDTYKPNKYFVSGENKKDIEQNESHSKKKFTFDSDAEEGCDYDGKKKKRKLKKKKAEKRALQISDDEEDENLDSEEAEQLSYLENDNEKIFEYDSEENEVEVMRDSSKKKRRRPEFFEEEAELTSEDEWVGSGDEDEAGLDRMEREAGDDDAFHQGRLRAELGQIHMREVLDQDKREVRMLQELLFEDGDLGGGSRQRKFRWANQQGEEETGAVFDVLNSQEEEYESEEQWRKQRHEREVFLRQMKNEGKGQDDSITNLVTTTQTTSDLLIEINSPALEEKSINEVSEKKIAKDIPSPKKAFSIFKSYHGSLLTRGGGALARLAALATPLVTDDDAPKLASLAPSTTRNFVFAAVTPDNEKPKVSKRKADNNVNTPQLVKKMKAEDKKNNYKSRLLDHFRT